MLEGQYRLERVVRTGASAMTFQAVRLTDRRVVAITEFSFHKLESFKTQELFEREARVLRKLDHPAIPSYIDSFTRASGREISLYLVHEFIDGQTLEEEAADRRYDEHEALAVLVELAEILAYLHELDPPVIHRDIRPANVMRRRGDGRLVLIDFGSVRDIMRNVAVGRSAIAGTVDFMAPEQLTDIAVPASDVYGLGTLAVCLLSGRRPHELLDADHELDWKAFVDVSPDLERLLDSMLAPRPRDRPRNGRILSDLLSSCVAVEPLPLIRSKPAPGPEVAAREHVARSPRVGGWKLRILVLFCFVFAPILWLTVLDTDDDPATGPPVAIPQRPALTPIIEPEPVGQLGLIVRRGMPLERARARLPGLGAPEAVDGGATRYRARLVIARQQMNCALTFSPVPWPANAPTDAVRATEQQGAPLVLNHIRCQAPVRQEGSGPMSFGGVVAFFERKYGPADRDAAEGLRWHGGKDVMVVSYGDGHVIVEVAGSTRQGLQQVDFEL